MRSAWDLFRVESLFFFDILLQLASQVPRLLRPRQTRATKAYQSNRSRFHAATGFAFLRIVDAVAIPL